MAASPSSLPGGRTVRSPFALTVVALWLAATAAIVLFFAWPADDPRSSSSAAAAPVAEGGPAGVITYSVTGGDDVSVRADGTRLAAARDPYQHDLPALNDTWTSPDGSLAARALRSASGVSLAISGPGSGAGSFSIAGPGDPELVAAGKTQAAAVDGVPLVAAWSPDSKRLAFGSLTGAPYFLNLTSPDFEVFRSYEVTGGYVGELVWSPDGRYLGISTYTMDRKNHTVFVYDVQRGGAPVRLSDGCHLVWSPDSKYLAIHRDPSPYPGAWVVSVDGENAYPLTDEVKAYPATWTAQ